jgi:hypothetical protein
MGSKLEGYPGNGRGARTEEVLFLVEVIWEVIDY